MRLLARFFLVLLISVIALSRPASGQLPDGGSNRDVSSAQYEQFESQNTAIGFNGEPVLLNQSHCLRASR